MAKKLIFRFGCMGSGKSLHLLSTAYNFQEHSIPFLILKSTIDTRDGKDVIHSRALGDRECVSVSPTDNIFSIISKYKSMSDATCSEFVKWILVDEAQFLSEDQVDQLAAVADRYDLNVACYGLRTDFKTHLFPGSKRLFEIADSIEEIKSSCYCGCKTMFNARMSNGKIITSGNQVEVGGDDKYVSLCRRCYYEKIGHPLYKKIENEEN